MGYRSDVAVVFYTRHNTTDRAAALKLWFDENYPVNDATSEWGAKIEKGEDWVMVSYEDVKWYNGYKHVDAVRESINKFTDTFDANNIDGIASWELIQIGEETNDIKEYRSDYCDYRLGVRREIYFG